MREEEEGRERQQRDAKVCRAREQLRAPTALARRLMRISRYRDIDEVSPIAREATTSASESAELTRLLGRGKFLAQTQTTR
jgi:hypothetical protein